MSHKLAFSYIALLLLVLFAEGCADPPSTNVPQAPAIPDRSYTNQFSGQVQEGKYRISYTTGTNSGINVDVDAAGIVIVTGTGASNQRRCDIKVSGDGVKFRIVNFDEVIIDEGAIVEVYNCDYVKVRNRAKVQAYSCYSVYALPDAELIKLQGCSNVQQAKKPQPPAAPPVQQKTPTSGAAAEPQELREEPKPSER